MISFPSTALMDSMISAGTVRVPLVDSILLFAYSFICRVHAHLPMITTPRFKLISDGIVPDLNDSSGIRVKRAADSLVLFIPRHTAFNLTPVSVSIIGMKLLSCEEMTVSSL